LVNRRDYHFRICRVDRKNGRIRRREVLGPAAGTTASAIAKRTLPSVVMLVLETNRGEVMGSGFVIAPNIVVTNNHVVKGARRGVVKFVGRDAPYQISRFTAFDPFNDLALVAITAPDVPSLTLRPDSSPELGDEIYVIGNPEGLEATFSRGNISGFRRRDGHDWLQITAPISHGSSGGPVLNASGEVIGVAVATLSNGQNLNFAVPAKYIRNLLTQSH
jgi:S1-C subfamily serine protease